MKANSQYTPVTLPMLLKMKQRGEKIACLTSYDATLTRLVERAGVDVVLVGDSLGMVIQGHENTLPVTVDEMIYHSANVARARKRSLLIVDMPFMSYTRPVVALENAGRLMKYGGAHVVKLEGGAVEGDVVQHLSSHGIPVCAHLGLLPQHVHKLGGYRVQGRAEDEAQRITREAQALEQAGADMLVLECVPQALASQVSRTLSIPVIGIGAGPECDGQVLVVYDMLGMYTGRAPRFTKNFLAEADSVEAALRAYVKAVKEMSFPGPEHGWT